MKRSYLKSIETDPPGGTELRFTMTPSNIAQGINAWVVFTQLKKGLRLNVELSVPSENKQFSVEDRVISDTNCSSNMPHLYMIKDTSCCTEPTHLKCTSVYGMKLECLSGPWFPTNDTYLMGQDYKPLYFIRPLFCAVIQGIRV